MSDEHRIQALTTYLTDDALTWCAQEIANDMTLSWNDVKNKFLARYGTAIIPPSVAAEQCRMTRRDTVQSYAQEKMRLLRLAEVPLKSSIPLLTAGTPPSYRPMLYASSPETFDEWLRLALTIENSTQDRPFRSRNENVNVTQRPQERNAQRGRNTSKRDDSPKPKTPCRYCQKRSIEAFHWHRKCPNKNEDNTKSATELKTQRETVPMLHAQSNFVYMDVKVNGIPTRAFLDTGSTLTVASRKLAKKLRLMVEENSSIQVDHVGGSTNSIGALSANITIGELTKKIVIHVFDHVVDELLLGVRDAAIFNLHADLEKRKLMQRLDGRKEAVNLSQDNVANPYKKLKTSIDDVTQNAIIAENRNDIGRINIANHRVRLRTCKPMHLR